MKNLHFINNRKKMLTPFNPVEYSIFLPLFEI
jgi:hypothetical protein